MAAEQSEEAMETFSEGGSEISRRGKNIEQDEGFEEEKNRELVNLWIYPIKWCPNMETREYGNLDANNNKWIWGTTKTC